MAVFVMNCLLYQITEYINSTIERTYQEAHQEAHQKRHSSEQGEVPPSLKPIRQRLYVLAFNSQWSYHMVLSNGLIKWSYQEGISRGHIIWPYQRDFK